MKAPRTEPVQLAAMMLALNCVRNSPLEDLHAGVFPKSATGDYSDVKVSTPYGEIPWSQLSRISNNEMKHFMTWVVDALYTALSDDPAEPRVLLQSPPDDWDRPKTQEQLLVKDPKFLAALKDHAKDHVVTVKQLIGLS